MIWGEIDFWPSSEPQPTPWRDVTVVYGGKALETRLSDLGDQSHGHIPPQAHHGDPLITNTTLVDLCVGCGCHYTMEI